MPKASASDFARSTRRASSWSMPRAYGGTKTASSRNLLIARRVVVVVRARELAKAEAAAARELIRDRGSIPATRRFEWWVVGLSTWLMAGAYLDSWAHRHLARLETFFTPWHALLYSGMLAILIFLALTALRNQARGHR